MAQHPPGRAAAWLREAGATLRRGLGARRSRTGDGRGVFRALLLTAVVLFAALAWAVDDLYAGASPDGAQLSFDSLTHLAGQGRVATARLLEEDSVVVGTYCPVAVAAADCSRAAALPQYWTRYLSSDALTPELLTALSAHATVTVDSQPGKAVVRFLAQFLLPLVILANLFGLIFLARSAGGSISDIVGFGAIGRRRGRRQRQSTGVTFADVAGAEEAVTELREVVDYLVDPDKYRAIGAQPPKGVLLFGPPGCGKTLLARAVAGEAGVPFFAISGAEFVESLVGVGAARVRDLFRQARRAAPAIIFIDELDAAGRRRGAGGGAGGSDEREQTLNQMLVAMDGFEVSSGIVVMGATNRPDILDPALLRPGRFDRHVTVDEPDLGGREAILALHARNRQMTAGVDLAEIARRTPGFTGADLANVINEAALLALREGHLEVRMPQLSEAIQRVLHGPRRRGHLLSADERARVACHESGHALVTAALGRTGDVSRLSIVARGRGLGTSMVSADAERVLHTRSDMEAQLVIAMGGLAAEELRFGEPSTAAEDDIEKASDIARQMAGRYGMSPGVGPVRLLAADADVYLGASATLATLAPETMRAFDEEVARLVAWARQRALALLEERSDDLQRLASRLEAVETLEGADLDVLLGTSRVVVVPAGD